MLKGTVGSAIPSFELAVSVFPFGPVGYPVRLDVKTERRSVKVSQSYIIFSFLFYFRKTTQRSETEKVTIEKPRRTNNMSVSHKLIHINISIYFIGLIKLN